MLSNAYFLAKFRFDTAENEPAKNLQNFRKMHSRIMPRFPLPGPWCICMWAFARAFLEDYSYMRRLDCAATNLWVLHGYDIANKNECVVLREMC